MDKIFSYQHRIQYYETDGMRIVHHSNYIRWMEEARTAMMEQLGYGYDRMEHDGISIPVLSVSCDYKEMMHFGQTCRIEVRVTAVSQVRMAVAYEFYDVKTGHLCGTGTTSHCFVGQNGCPVSLKKKLPDIYELFCSTLYTPDEA